MPNFNTKRSRQITHIIRQKLIMTILVLFQKYAKEYLHFLYYLNMLKLPIKSSNSILVFLMLTFESY